MEGFSFREAANYVLGFIVVVMGWDINKLADFKDRVTNDYVRRDDLADFMNRTDNTLDRILEKLDGKQDK